MREIISLGEALSQLGVASQEVLVRMGGGAGGGAQVSSLHYPNGGNTYRDDEEGFGSYFASSVRPQRILRTGERAKCPYCGKRQIVGDIAECVRCGGNLEANVL